MKSKGQQLRLHYLAWLSIKMENKIKSFTKKKKKGVYFHKTSIARDAKETAFKRKIKTEEHRYKGKKNVSE